MDDAARLREIALQVEKDAEAIVEILTIIGKEFRKVFPDHIVLNGEDRPDTLGEVYACLVFMREEIERLRK